MCSSSLFIACAQSVRDSGSTFAACNISLRASPRIKEMRELTWWPLPVRGELGAVARSVISRANASPLELSL